MVIHSFRNLQTGAGNIRDVYNKIITPCGIGDFLKGCKTLYNLKQIYNYDLVVDLKNHPVGYYFKGEELNIRNMYVNEFFNHHEFLMLDFIKQMSNTEKYVFFTNGNLFDRTMTDAGIKFISQYFQFNDWFVQDCTIELQKQYNLQPKSYYVISIRADDHTWNINNDLNNDNHKNHIAGTISRADSIIDTVSQSVQLNECLLITNSLHIRKHAAEKYNLISTNTDPRHTAFEYDYLKLKDTMFDLFAIINSKKIFGTKSAFAQEFAPLHGIEFVQFKSFFNN